MITNAALRCLFLLIASPVNLPVPSLRMLNVNLVINYWITDNVLLPAAGNIVCSWGRGEDGQLGLGDAEDRTTPTQLSALDDHGIISVTCGADHTTAYSESQAELYSWGWWVFFLSLPPSLCIHPSCHGNYVLGCHSEWCTSCLPWHCLSCS